MADAESVYPECSRRGQWGEENVLAADRPGATAEPYNLFGTLPLPLGEETMPLPSFWSAFEETSDERLIDNSTKTQTRAREGPDQQSAFALTKTVTAQKEQPDQHQCLGGMATVPRAAQTQTMTKMREEQDQDPVRSGLETIPRQLMAKTVTEVQREQPDQDARRLASIPRAAGVLA